MSERNQLGNARDDQRSASSFAAFILAYVMALAIIVGIAVATAWAPGDPGRAHAAQSVVVDVGSDWFCSDAFEGGVCETAIQVGDSVGWNFVEGSHNATECGDNWSKGNSCDGAEWKSAIVVPPPGTFSHQFDAAGTFYYRCTIHPNLMKGTVVVTAASTPAPTPSPTPSATPPPTPTPSATPATSPTPTATPLPTTAPPPTATNPPSPSTTATPGPATGTPSPTPLATTGPSPSPTATPAPTAPPAATTNASPQPGQSTQPPAGDGPASIPNDPVLGAGELPHGGGWPWTTKGFDLVGLLFAINLPLAALAFSAFRWYLQRRSAA